MSDGASTPPAAAAPSGERRQVTVLFADMVGFTAISERLGEEGVFALIRPIYDLMAGAVTEQGGSVKDFTGDGIMALFGVPEAQEDAPLRACRAGLLIQMRLAAAAPAIEAAHRVQPQMRIGINSGLAVVTQIRSESDAMTALGDTVNLASRLQTLAEPGTVYLSNATQRLVQGLVETTFAGAHAIKGKAEPQKVWRLDSVRQGATRFEAAVGRGLSAYVGRAREIGILKSALAESRDGLRVIDIVAEPGMGKSRLLHEFRQTIGKQRAPDRKLLARRTANALPSVHRDRARLVSAQSRRGREGSRAQVGDRTEGAPLAFSGASRFAAQSTRPRSVGRGAGRTRRRVGRPPHARLVAVVVGDALPHLGRRPVIGRRFDPRLLAVAADIAGDLDGRLAAMQALDLVHSEGKSGDYAFKHALVRDALYQSLLTVPRAALHLKIANEIERRNGNRLVEVSEQLAHHYSATARTEKAFRYLSMSGRKSLDVYSIEEAEQFFRRALDLADSQKIDASREAIADAIVGNLEANYLKCDMVETKRVAERYLPQLEAMGDTPQLVFALYFLGSAIQGNYEFKEAERRAKRALAISERIGDVRAIAYARMLLLSCSTVLGRFPLETSEQIDLRVLSESQQAGDNYVLNWTYFCIAWDYGVRGLMKEAQAWALKLLESGRERGDGRALGFSHLTMSWLAMVDARYEDALKHAETCLEVAVTQFDRVYGAAAKATATIFVGKPEEGLPRLLELRRSVIEGGVSYAASGMHGAAGVGLVITGRIADGIRLIRDSIDGADAAGDCGVGFWNRIILAEIYLELVTSRQRPPLRFVVKNFGAIIGATIFGKGGARALLERASRFEQLHERGAIRARINMDLGPIYKIEGKRELVRQFLEKGRGPAEQQGASFIVNKIDAALAELR
jgi:class 3 adenylate cyclase/tetratricopeptide (TPR) repeat protein